MRVDPVSLKLFLYVVEQGTIAAGASRLNIVNSAASKRLQELEVALDAQLLRRTNRGIEPTAAGVALIGLAQEIINDLDSIKVKMRDYARGRRGQVRLLASQAAICQILPLHLATFSMEQPDVQVSFEERDNSSVFKALRENSFDVGVSIASSGNPDLQQIPYHRYRLAVVGPKDHKLSTSGSLTFTELLEYPQIGLQVGGPISNFYMRMAAVYGKNINYRINVESYHSLLLMVHAGLGVGIVPTTLLNFFSSNLNIQVIDLDEEWAERHLSIYHRKNEKLEAATQLLVDHLRSASNVYQKTDFT